MDKIKYTITAYVPGSLCNFRCSYCYISKCVEETHLMKGVYHYPVETMVNAFSPKRLGGLANIVVIGSGETLIDDQVVPFIKGLLHQGHVVEVVTNMTLTDRIDELLDCPVEDLKRLIVKGSLHWHELKRLNKIDDYFNNMKKIIAKGASSFPFVVICDDYMNDLDEIRQTCLDRIGALPHCTPAMSYEEKSDFVRKGRVTTSPELTDDFVKMIDEKFHSKIFGLSAKWLDIDVKKVFCYAGKWSFIVNLSDGNFLKCHGCPAEANFFKNPNEMPKMCAIGNNCQIASCMLQYNFIAQGVIPVHDDMETYSDILTDGRKHLFTETVTRMLDFKYPQVKKTYFRFLEYFINKKVEKKFIKKK